MHCGLGSTSPQDKQRNEQLTLSNFILSHATPIYTVLYFQHTSHTSLYSSSSSSVSSSSSSSSIHAQTHSYIRSRQFCIRAQNHLSFGSCGLIIKLYQLASYFIVLLFADLSLILVKMMYEQQQVQNQMMLSMDMRNNKVIDGRDPTDEERLEIVDLSGMSLDSLPNPSLNLATICKLNLSNNNLQVSL